MMKKSLHLVSLLGVAASAYGLAGCGGDEVTCGTGTVLMGDACVPTSTTTCGTGTVLVGGQCVPDGSVICEQGTVFDMASGQCVVDPSACADGTVLVGGVCIPDDENLMADLEEAAEPNDANPTGAGTITVPALNADITIHGCITPRAGVRDEDVWIMSVTAPTLLEITADGVGGLAAGFIVQDLGIPALPNYFRAGINLTGDTSRRQVYLPSAGDYVLVMDDSRAILVDETAGGADTCYYTTIKTVALPAATTLTIPQTTGNDSGDVRVLNFTADANGDILRTLQTTTSASLSLAFVVMRGNTLLGSAAPSTNPTTGATNPPQWWEGGMNTGDVISVIVDNQYNFSPNPQPYTLDMFDLSADALPTTGTPLTIMGKRAGSDPTGDPTKFNYLWFDVAGAGALIHWNLTSSIGVDMVLVRSDVITAGPTGIALQTFATPNGLGTASGTRTAFQNEFTRFLAPGRYYLIVQNPIAGAVLNESIIITSTLTPVTPTALTYGTAMTAQPLTATGAAFHTIDLTTPTWVEFAATGTQWGTNIVVSAFDLAGEGWVGNTGYTAAFSGSRVAAGTDPFGRIMIGDTRDFLVRVTSSTTPGTTPTYDLNIRTRPHISIGLIQPGTPINRTGDAIAATSDAAGAQNATRYLVTGLSLGGYQAVVTPAVAQNSNINIRRLNADESVSGAVINVGGDGAAETLAASFGTFPTGNWVAFTVGSSDTEASTIDVASTSTNPPYTPTSGTLAFVDACGTGSTVIMTGQDDTLSATTALPAMFATWPFFGTATSGSVKFSSNGWLTFNTAETSSGGANAPIPTAGTPNGLIAPFWEDLNGVTICTRVNTAGDVFTVQWTGFLYNTAAETAQFQLVMRANGGMDFIYGPNHLINGSEIPQFGSDGATVGVENLAGTTGYQFHYNTNSVNPSTSRTLTPGT